jgi:serralysin
VTIFDWYHLREAQGEADNMRNFLELTARPTLGSLRPNSSDGISRAQSISAEPMLADNALDGDILDAGKGDAVHSSECGCAACGASDGKDFAPGGGNTFAPDTVPGDVSSTATVPVGGNIQGSIDTATDSDWYRITLVAGQSYTFSTILGSIGDTVLRLRDSSGNQIATNDDVGGGYLWSEIRYTATTSGTFFLDVTGFGGDTGTFYLTSTAPVADSIAASTATTATLTIGAAATSGTLEATGDHDWFAVTLTAGQAYEFTTTSTGGANIDTTLYLRNASGALLAYNDDNVGTFSRIRFTAATSGTYYLDLGAWGNAESGGYRVQAAVAEPLAVYTNDQIATQLTNTYWGGTQRRWNVTTGGTITFNVQALTADGQNLAREALLLWTDATGITFSEVTTGGQITFDDNQSGAFATSTVSGGIISASQVNVSTQWLVNSGTSLRSYSFQTYVHEIGHALGLGHGGPYNGNANYSQDATYANDAWSTTIMSYFDQSENTYFNNLGFTVAFAVTPMVADLVATSNLYGATATTRTGNTTYGVGNNTGRASFDATANETPLAVTIVDSGGIDTLNYSIYSNTQRINLNAETFSNIGGRTGNLIIARGTVIENAIGGSGIDTIIGNSANNQLNGGAGNDILIGGGGSDILDGGDGIDTADYSGSTAATNSVNLATGVQTETGGATDTLSNIENVFGSGNIDVLTGNNIANELYGNAGNDEVYGLGGSDYMSGGDGADYLSGGAGDDLMIGGAGADIVLGGLGDDSYYQITPDDLIVEYDGQGNDRIYTEVDYTLRAGSYIETLGTTANVGTAAINLTGNELVNIVIGNDGVNRIDGGAGSDSLYGGAGTDYFYFSSTLGASNVDVVGDFASVDDLLMIDRRVFSNGLATGFADASAFLSGAGATSATTAAQRFIHDSTTGDLYFDIDGVGGQAAVRFANIGAGTAIQSYDFFVI